MKTDVLVVGAGPVGMLAALMLHEQGLNVTIVDRRFERSSAPRAHAVNPRSLEICDALGISASDLRRRGASPAEAGWVRFVSSVTGTEYGSLPYERQQDDTLAITPFPLSNLAQPEFEAAIATRLGQCDGVSLIRGARWLAGEQDDAGVTSRVRMGARELTIESRWLLGADGAGSAVREASGIELEGLRDLQHHVMLHFEADLSGAVADRPGMLFFCFHPEFSSVLLGFDVRRSWVLMHGYDPNSQSPEDFTEAHARALAEQAVGTSIPDFRLCHASPWSMCAEVASRYRDGRIFLLGDAAHRFPPTGGLGLNTGVADAFNLAWKIAAVDRAEAGEALLDSYEIERRPVAQANTQQSLTNSAKILELVGALFGPDPAAGPARLREIMKDPSAYPEVAAAVEVQRPHFDSIDLQLGYRYHSAVLEGSEPVPLAEDISDYQPSWAVGAHVPHRWLEEDGTRISLLSLLSPDGFTLILGPEAGTLEEIPGVQQLHWDQSLRGDAVPWAQLTGLPEAGALLIRPDRHICARLEGEALEAAVHGALATARAQHHERRAA